MYVKVENLPIIFLALFCFVIFSLSAVVAFKAFNWLFNCWSVKLVPGWLTLLNKKSIFLLGFKYYNSNNTGEQGPGINNSEPNFNFQYDLFPNYRYQSFFTYPNLNFSFFGENIFKSIIYSYKLLTIKIISI